MTASDLDLIERLEPALGGAIQALTRQHYPYATSFPLEELLIRLEDGRELTLIFKDLAWSRLLPPAREAKPEFLYAPQRALLTHTQILPQLGVGAHCYLAYAAPHREQFWLVTEKAPGLELWQIGELTAWASVARWLARFHAAGASCLDDALAVNPHLIVYTSATFEMWAQRAR